MTIGSFPRAVEIKTVALTSTVEPIGSSNIDFASTNITAADVAFITANTSNASVVAWATTAPSATLGHTVAIGQPLTVLGNYNVQKICLVSATTLAATVSVTLSKY